MYRKKTGTIEVLLVHPGGPLWKNKDQGAWSIPKGEYESCEPPFEAAKREFEEELGFPPPSENFIELGEIRQKNGKRVCAWAVKGDCDPSLISSNTFSMQWPPGSGKTRQFPEVDRAGWFDTDTAREKINPAQTNFIDALENILDKAGTGSRKNA